MMTWITEEEFQFYKQGSESSEALEWLEFPYDVPYEFSKVRNLQYINNSNYTASGFKMIIYGPYIYYQVIAMRKGIRALLRADLIRLYNKYHDDHGYCPLYVKQSLEDEYKQYHTLKGNGVGTQMYNALMALPTEPQHEGEE